MADCGYESDDGARCLREPHDGPHIVESADMVARRRSERLVYKFTNTNAEPLVISLPDDINLAVARGQTIWIRVTNGRKE
jgi:hypothetical protein